MSLVVMRAGPLSTIQDLGRQGYQAYGVPVGGAMDEFAARTANLLVGNAENTALIEVTLAGAEFRFERSCAIAVCGADLGAELSIRAVTADEELSENVILATVSENLLKVPLWRKIIVESGTFLRFKRTIQGCRAYVAVSGGFDIPEVLGSCSTYLPGRFGGLEGRALRTGDRLKLGAGATRTLYHEERWGISHHMLPAYMDDPVIRVIRGRDWAQFDPDSQALFRTSDYEITASSNRMGYRLRGAPLIRTVQAELLSEPAAMGSIQVPADGMPIILMADRQPTGGYPIVGQAVSVDLPLLAQARPGSRLRFELISLGEAQRLHLFREWELRVLRAGLIEKQKKIDT
jgi:antagonist of KipI